MSDLTSRSEVVELVCECYRDLTGKDPEVILNSGGTSRYKGNVEETSTSQPQSHMEPKTMSAAETKPQDSNTTKSFFGKMKDFIMNAEFSTGAAVGAVAASATIYGVASYKVNKAKKESSQTEGSGNL